MGYGRGEFRGIPLVNNPEYDIKRHKSDTLQTRRRVEEYEDAKRLSTSSSHRLKIYIGLQASESREAK
jgi:hypothetical protein